MRILNAETCGHSFEVEDAVALHAIATRQSFTFDCPGDDRDGACNMLLYMAYKDGQPVAVDFHKEMNRQNDAWPANGEGTFSTPLEDFSVE